MEQKETISRKIKELIEQYNSEDEIVIDVIPHYAIGASCKNLLTSVELITTPIYK